VTATFAVGTASLTVQKSGTGGTGTVVSDIAGIDCGETCSANFSNGQNVILTATADTPSSTFTGWTGACAGAGTNLMCPLMIQSGVPLTAIANFAPTVHVLTVQNVGNGTGTTTSSPGTISCPGTCNQGFNYGTDVQLFAAPDTGSSFTGWSGGGAACTGTGSCTVDVTTATTVMAQYTLNTHTLLVSKTGTGSGGVTSNVGTIDCGLSCTDDYDYGTDVTLTPAADMGSTFTGWSGACTGMGPCVVDMLGNQEAIANFDINTYLVDVVISGAGSSVNGVVSVSDGGIDCGNGGNDCSELYDYNYNVQLKSNETNGYTLNTWSGGGCTGNGTCSFSVTDNTTITATFQDSIHTLTVAVTGAPGRVTSNPAGITCANYAGGGSDCTEAFVYNTGVSLSGSGNPPGPPGSIFNGWSGDCSGASCNVSMTTNRSVTANFILSTHVLTVTSTDSGTLGDNDGSGSASSSPAGVTCSAAGGTLSGDCNHTYNYGQSVQITAAPSYGSTFTGWSGCDSVSGTGNVTCNVAMTNGRNVNMQFDRVNPNFVFILGTAITGNLGGLSAADTLCENAAASNATIPDGNYVAYLSTSTTAATSRLTLAAGGANASGWVRYDGLPVFDTVADIQAGKQFYPIKYSHTGTAIAEVSSPGNIMTGTGSTGAFYSTGTSCSNYTSAVSASVGGGLPSAQGSLWSFLAGTQPNCTGASPTPMYIYCFGVDRAAVARPSTGSFRRAFTTTANFTPSSSYGASGIDEADALCASEATAGGLTGTYKAMMATVGASAISRFTTGGSSLPWARPDNTLVAGSSGALAVAQTHLLATPNSNAAGTTYVAGANAWTGATDLITAGTVASTCNNWTDPTMIARAGQPSHTLMSRWFNYQGLLCSQAFKIYCFQQ
jgi:hypothetical protein